MAKTQFQGIAKLIHNMMQGSDHEGFRPRSISENEELFKISPGHLSAYTEDTEWLSDGKGDDADDDMIALMMSSFSLLSIPSFSELNFILEDDESSSREEDEDEGKGFVQEECGSTSATDLCEKSSRKEVHDSLVAPRANGLASHPRIQSDLKVDCNDKDPPRDTLVQLFSYHRRSSITTTSSCPLRNRPLLLPLPYIERRTLAPDDSSMPLSVSAKDRPPSCPSRSSSL